MVQKEDLLTLVWMNVTAIHEVLWLPGFGKMRHLSLPFGEAAELSVPDWLTQVREKTGS